MKFFSFLPTKLPLELAQAEIIGWREQATDKSFSFFTTHNGAQLTLDVHGLNSPHLFALTVKKGLNSKTYKFDELPERWKILPLDNALPTNDL